MQSPGGSRQPGPGSPREESTIHGREAGANLIRAKTILRKPQRKKIERRHSDVANPGFGQ